MVTQNLMATYLLDFSKADAFTVTQGFKKDSPNQTFDPTKVFDQSGNKCSIEKIASEISDFLAKVFLPNYSKQGYKPVNRLAGDCANVHNAIYEYFKTYFPSVPVNITIGDVNLEGYGGFNFDQNKFLRFTKERPEVFDAHAWLTIGQTYIFDATIPTYITYRKFSQQGQSGVFIGRVDDINFIPPVNGNQNNPLKNRSLNIRYKPIALGMQALRAIQR